MAFACGVCDVEVSSPTRQLIELIGESDHLVFVLLDGLGMNIIRRLPAESFIARHFKLELLATCPSTTACALTTVATADYPGRHGVTVTEEDPWGYCSSLEWATSCPPPRHNFYRIPRIRSERPAFEAHYPHIKWGRESAGIEQTIPAIESARK